MNKTDAIKWSSRFEHQGYIVPEVQCFQICRNSILCDSGWNPDEDNVIEEGGDIIVP